MQAFEPNLPATTTQADVAFSGELLYANGNEGLQLLNSGVRTNYLRELDALKSLGLKAVVVNIGFPVLYQPFYESNGDPQDYQSMLGFYQQVIVDVHAAGLKAIVETQSIFPGFYTQNSGYPTLLTFFEGLSLEEFEQDCASQIATIYSQIQPDYINIGSEPDTDANNSGQKELDNPANWAAYVSLVLSGIPTPHTSLMGSGVGNWLVTTGAEFVTDEAAIADLDYIDLHAYPVVTVAGINTFSNLLNEINTAEAAGKRVAISEYWLLKISGSDLVTNNPADPDTDSLDAYSFWMPLDEEYLTDIYKLANWKNFIYASAFWSDYFWGYLTYSASGPAPGDALITASVTNADEALAGGQRTGTAYTEQSLLLNGVLPPVVASSANFTTAVAVGSLASIFGTNLSTATLAATGALGTTLGGVTVSVTDSALNTQAADLLYVSPGQINFVIPSGLATGTATVVVTSGTVSQETVMNLSVTAPGLFSEGGTGGGVAAAETLTVSGANQTYAFVFSCATGTCQPVPIDVSGGQTYLILYGTGISGAGQSAVSITVGGMTLPVEFAGALSEFAGLDQVNVLLPAALAGTGVVPVQVTVGGVASNSVQIEIQ
jgi:uncharacterized protein (TIGR03437 family)